MSGIRIGTVTHYYNKIGVAVIALSDKIRVGDTVHIMGSTTDLKQQVQSLQIEHQPVEEASPGDDIALKVDRRVRRRDRVYRLDDEG